jgi:hydrogenase maturation protein HypF
LARPSPLPTTKTLAITLTGHVQGVGFRPFVYRLATTHGLTGYVQNRLGEVRIVVTGAADTLVDFQDNLLNSAPPLSRPRLDSCEECEPGAWTGFSIVDSATDAPARIFVPPDYFMCDDCRRELEDPTDRRYRYPFINCTQCGPRYTLIERLPYDRANTSMAAFELCQPCRQDYEDPTDRRFHAEPVACPDCGPAIRIESEGASTPDGEAALDAALASLRAGRILAIKGVGGYHLVCDAANAAAVDRLRRRKVRPDKPFAVMFPMSGDDGLREVGREVELSPEEARLLAGPMRPILLARKRANPTVAANVAPGLAELGVFLPYAPLHHLLLQEFGGPIVATSANISGEPVLTDDVEVSRRLASIADEFLHHDRPILRPADDPVYRTIAGAPRPLRIGRGSAPRELCLAQPVPQPVLAVGGHMKGTVALAWGDRAVVSPHIGEMDSPRSMRVFETVADDLQRLYGVEAAVAVCDAHPGYATHRWARDRSGLPVTSVWHHAAHASAVAGEFPGSDHWLVFTWDGVGLGDDGSLWGGEALAGAPGRWRRVASMRPFSLPGGDRAGREPWRSAAALLWGCGRDIPRRLAGADIARKAWERRINCPTSTAAGRLFDAASALVLGIDRVSFEAQGPMQLEALCAEPGEVLPLPLCADDAGLWRSDWEPLLEMLLDDSRSQADRAQSFHTSMAHALREQVRRIAATDRVERVGLAGGVFQNRLLTRQVAELLREDGLEVFMGEALPANDAALSFGQLVEFASGTRA